MRTELVLFDLDGTLLDGSGLPDAMRRTCEVLAGRLEGVSADDLVAANTAAWQRLWPEAEDDWLLGSRDGDEIAADAWRATLAGLGSDAPDLLDLAQATWRREERGAFRLFDDALPALDALRAAGVRTGLVTNGAASVQHRKLEAVGIADRLDPLVVSGEARLRKPDPELFEVALHRAGVRAEAAWYVGDNLWHDVVPAAAAGLRTAWIDRWDVALREDWPQPDRVVTALTSLAGLVDQGPS